jgi:hypothetical protein
MERHEILEAMTELKLYGMRASFDEIAGKGLNRRDEIFPLLASLIRAERTHDVLKMVGTELHEQSHLLTCDVSSGQFGSRRGC